MCDRSGRYKLSSCMSIWALVVRVVKSVMSTLVCLRGSKCWSSATCDELHMYHKFCDKEAVTRLQFRSVDDKFVFYRKIECEL